MGRARAWWAMALIGAAVLLGSARGAMAQWDAYQPQFTSTQLEEAMRTLAMDSEQREVTRSLHEAYLTSHQAAVTKMQEYMEEVQRIAEAEQNWEIWRETTGVWVDFQKYSRSIRDRFVADLKMMLTDEQSAHWDRFERGLRRSQEIGQNYYLGFISGAKVDLVEIIEELPLDESTRASIDPELVSYEIELDRSLVATRAFIDQWEEKAREMNFEENATEMATVYKDGVAMVSGIRDINKRHADRLEARLPEESRRAFRKAFNTDAYPAIYRVNAAERTLERALGLEDLRDDQRERLVLIKDQYERELAGANARWAEATVRWEGERTMMSFQGQEEEPDWLKAAKELRTRLDERTNEKIESVLTAEQLERLPGRGGKTVERPVFGQ